MKNTTNIILGMGHPIMLCYKYLNMKKQPDTNILHMPYRNPSKGCSNENK